jgi:hypothetical protein
MSTGIASPWRGSATQALAPNTTPPSCALGSLVTMMPPGPPPVPPPLPALDGSPEHAASTKGIRTDERAILTNGMTFPRGNGSSSTQARGSGDTAAHGVASTLVGAVEIARAGDTFVVRTVTDGAISGAMQMTGAFGAGAEQRAGGLFGVGAIDVGDAFDA